MKTKWDRMYKTVLGTLKCLMTCYIDISISIWWRRGKRSIGEEVGPGGFPEGDQSPALLGISQNVRHCALQDSPKQTGTHTLVIYFYSLFQL